MLWLKYTYKWYSLEQLYTSEYDSYNDSKYLLGSELLFLETVKDDPKIRMDSVSNSNRHGGYIWPWLVEPRLITMTGKIFAPKDDNWLPQLWRLEKKIDDLKKNLSIERNPMLDWYHELKRWNRYNEQRVAMAKVYKMPQIDHDRVNPYATFTIELLCGDPFYYHPTTRTVSGWNTVIWGTYLPNTLPNSWWLASWSSMRPNNQGNALALCKITIQWHGNNVTIFNRTNWYKTRVLWDTYNLTIQSFSGANWEFSYEILEWNNSIKARTWYWAWILLNPWENEILVTSDLTNPLNVTIEWRDTYI